MVVTKQRLAVWRAESWWPVTAGYLAVVGALAGALLLPVLFSDPNGIDPHALRLAAVCLALTAASRFDRRLRPAYPVAIAISAAVVSYCLWHLTFDLSLAGGQVTLLAGALQGVVTLAFVVWLLRAMRPGTRPALRIAHFGVPALVATVVGTCGVVLIGLALPAQPLGREGIATVAAGFALGQGYVAGDILQALAQELQFRSVLLGALEPALGFWRANIAQASLFGLGHLALEAYEGPVGPLIPITVLLGLLLGWITQRTRSIWPAVAIHAALEVGIRIAILPGLYGT